MKYVKSSLCTPSLLIVQKNKHKTFYKYLSIEAWKYLVFYLWSRFGLKHSSWFVCVWGEYQSTLEMEQNCRYLTDWPSVEQTFALQCYFEPNREEILWFRKRLGDLCSHQDQCWAPAVARADCPRRYHRCLRGPPPAPPRPRRPCWRLSCVWSWRCRCSSLRASGGGAARRRTPAGSSGGSCSGPAPGSATCGRYCACKYFLSRHHKIFRGKYKYILTILNLELWLCSVYCWKIFREKKIWEILILLSSCEYIHIHKLDLSCYRIIWEVEVPVHKPGCVCMALFPWH